MGGVLYLTLAVGVGVGVNLTSSDVTGGGAGERGDQIASGN